MLFGLLPDCARNGCASGLPAFFKLEVEDSGQKVTAFLCPSCIKEFRACVKTASDFLVEERKLLESREEPPPDVPRLTG